MRSTPSRSAALAALAASISALPAVGCLDPLTDDELGPSGFILPAGASVASAHDDPAIERQIDQNDGVGDVVPLVHGFAGGGPVAFRDFGPAPDVAAPLFVLVREGAGGRERIDHPTIIDAIPGDPGYSPFWAVLEVPVTDAYGGELITSFAAVQEAERLGLVEAPRQTGAAVNCPVVGGGVTVEVGGGDAVRANARFFWQGRTVDYFDLGEMPLEAGSRVAEGLRYVIRRRGDEPLSEPVRRVDLTGDGDRDDSNDVLAGTGQEGGSPLCRAVDVVVEAGTEAIDTFADQTMSAIRAETDLFDPEPIEGVVVAYEETEDLRNCARQREDGGL